MGVVNSEGETPLDIAEEEAMVELLQNEINRQGALSQQGVCDFITAMRPDKRPVCIIGIMQSDYGGID